jgi:hypothetical protein
MDFFLLDHKKVVMQNAVWAMTHCVCIPVPTVPKIQLSI